MAASGRGTRLIEAACATLAIVVLNTPDLSGLLLSPQWAQWGLAAGGVALVVRTIALLIAQPEQPWLDIYTRLAFWIGITAASAHLFAILTVSVALAAVAAIRHSTLVREAPPAGRRSVQG